MGTIETRKKLRELLLSFEIRDECLIEIMKWFQKRGNDIDLLAEFETQLSNLKKYGRDAAVVFPSSRFEKLKYKGTEQLFSMHVDTNEVNYRIIYTCLDDGTILLHGFFERAGKKATDYTSAIPKAQTRLQDSKER